MSQLAFLLGLVVLPYVAFVGGFALLFRTQLRRPKTASKIPLYSLATSAVLITTVVVWGFYFIFSSSSSTAGIGFLFVPIYALGAAIAGFIIAWAFLTLAALSSGVRARLFAEKPTPTVASVAVAALLIGPAVGLLYGPRALLLSEASSLETPVRRLHEIAGVAVAKNDLRTLARLAGNRGAPASVLEKMHKTCAASKKELTATPCYAVFLQLAAHKNTPAPLLDVLARNSRSSIRANVARNQATPVSLLERLSSDEDAHVRSSLTWNPNLPLTALAKLTQDDDESVRLRAEEVMERRNREGE